MENTEKRVLEPGKTAIGEKAGRYGDTPAVLTVYYGNYAMPPINGEYVHLNREAYLSLLNDFLASPEGSKYIVPTEEEKKEAEKQILIFQLEAQRKRDETLKQMKLEDEKRAAEKAKAQEEESKSKPLPEDDEEVKPEEEFRSKKELRREAKARKKEEQKAQREEEKEREAAEPKYVMDKRTKLYRKLCFILSGAVILLSLIIGLLMLFIVTLLMR